MTPPATIPTDSARAAAPADALKRTEPAVNLLDVVGGAMDSAKKNALAPLVNSFALEPINAGANAVNCASDILTYGVNKLSGQKYEALHVGKVGTMEVGHAEEGTGAAYSQQIFGTAGSFLVYAVASKVAGKGLRFAGEAAPLELRIGGMQVGQAVRAAVQDSRTATVLGATTYAWFKDTKNDETHFSNAAGTLIGFTLFEAGNSKLTVGAGALQSFTERYLVGAAGGVAQANVASLITHHKLAGADADKEAAFGGGFLNALMPGGRIIVDRAIENPIVRGLPHANEVAARLHIDAVRENAVSQPRGQKPEPGSWADPAAKSALDRASRADLHLKVKVDDLGPTRLDQKENVAYLAKGADPLDLIQELAHRRIYKDPKFDKQFKSHASEIKSTNPADPRNAPVKESYIETRIDQEVEARTAQNEEAIKLGASRRVSVDADEIRNQEGYGARFEKEADEFITSNGKYRPELDRASGDAFNYQSRKLSDGTEHTFVNAHQPGHDHNHFEQQPDKTVVNLGYQSHGPLKIIFPNGHGHSVNLGEPINHVRIHAKANGEHNYYFNKKGSPQLTVNAEFNELKVAPRNGDKILITGVDGQGATLPFADGTHAVLSGSGRLTVTVPGKPMQSVNLGATPGRLAVVEKTDGSKLFLLADEGALKKVQLQIGPTVAPVAVDYVPGRAAAQPTPPPPGRFARPTPRQNVPPRFDRPSQVQGGMPGTPGRDTYVEGSYPTDISPEADRYPLQVEFPHSVARYVEGVDQRALPDRDMSNPQDVFIAQQGHFGPLETFLDNLGRHETESNDSLYPW